MILAKDSFPAPYNSEPTDRGKPLSADASAAEIRLPAGFQARVVASEPIIQNPIAMTWDTRGKLWVAENFTYAEGSMRFDYDLRDRITLLEDTNGDGRFDHHRIFIDSLQILTGLEVGHGGVWAMCPPRLLFIPDRNHDDIPDGPIETVLDGFDIAGPSYHNFANGLKFGPDGWLYGRCGHSCPALIGSPGCNDEQRMPMEGGLWRYSPYTGQVEVLTTGTTNPWGHDWNAECECFFVNTVNGHLWHLIPGAHFDQTNGIDPNPYTYELIDQHADHYHFDVGKGWQNSRDGKANDLGGGHAHSGCMIYSGTNWPTEYRDQLFTLNFHGRRLNQERLSRSESGYIATHSPDFFHTGDTWFRGIDVGNGPDGSVVVLDWSDTGECHERDGVHRTSGRVFQIVAGEPHLPDGISAGFDLRQFSDDELAQCQRRAEGWWVNQSRRVLAERASRKNMSTSTEYLLQKQFENAQQLSNDDPQVSASAHRVRAMLTLHLIGKLQSEELIARLHHPDEHVRAWAVRLLTEALPLDAALGPVNMDARRAKQIYVASSALLDHLTEIARDDRSAFVRLVLASTLQRLPVEMRPQLAEALFVHAEDASDQNLPLLVWYGLIPLGKDNPDALADLGAKCQWPRTLKLISRRVAGGIESHPSAVNRLLISGQASLQNDMGVALEATLTGLREGLAGWKNAPEPTAWKTIHHAIREVSNDKRQAVLQSLVEELSVVFGDGRALSVVRETALNSKLSMETRRAAIGTLIEAEPPDLRSICEKVIKNRHLQATAAEGLTLFDDPSVGELLVNTLRRARGAGKEAILNALVSRVTFADKLVSALENGEIKAEDLSARLVRNIHSLEDPSLSQRLTGAWGHVQESSSEKRKRMQLLTRMLSRPSTEPSDLAMGRIVFEKNCGTCHKLYGEGGTLGPDLTGSGRHDLNYLVENIIDPSAVVNRDWRLTILRLLDGRVLSGVVIDENEKTLSVLTQQERTVILLKDIEERILTNQSPMPDGLLDKLSEKQTRNLIAYLRHPTQVAMP